MHKKCMDLKFLMTRTQTDMVKEINKSFERVLKGYLRHKPKKATTDSSTSTIYESAFKLV
jgi:hypothetical protein